MKPTIRNFKFEHISEKQYLVTYIQSNTLTIYSKIVTDMDLIDKTRNSDNPKQKYLNKLKSIVKNNNQCI